MFMAALKSKCSSIKEWSYKLWHMHIMKMEYYLAIKRNEALICAALVNLENIVGERNQTQNLTYSLIPFILNNHNR